MDTVVLVFDERGRRRVGLIYTPLLRRLSRSEIIALLRAIDESLELEVDDEL